MVGSWSFDSGSATFGQDVLERSREAPVLVDFWAPWCGPCRALTPVLEKLIDERKGDVLLAKVNIDDNQDLAGYFGIQSIPTVIAFRGGQPVIDFMGLLPEAQLREFLDQLTPSQADRLVQQATALETTNPAEAEKLFRQALEVDRHHEAAQLGLARVLVAQQQDAAAKEILENLATGGEIDRLKAILALRELAHLADEATARQRLEIDAKDAAAKVREAMVKVFQAIGVRDPLADEYRDKLSALLY
jgi:putative thioredoxin